MSLSRRPARFRRPDFKQTKPINEEKLEVLRAAAARVYNNKQNDPAEKPLVKEVNKVATGNAGKKVDEAEHDGGVELLASVAVGFGVNVGMGRKQKLDVGKKAVSEISMCDTP